MHARVSTYEGSVEDYDRGTEKMKSDIAPRVQAMAGCKGILTMLDRSTGRSLSITLWDNEEALAGSREEADRVRSEAASTTGSTITDVTEYEVTVAEWF
jgi:hypothetical protein